MLGLGLGCEVVSDRRLVYVRWASKQKKKVRDSSRRQHKNIFTLFHFVVNVAQHQNFWGKTPTKTFDKTVKLGFRTAVYLSVAFD